MQSPEVMERTTSLLSYVDWIAQLRETLEVFGYESAQVPYETCCVWRKVSFCGLVKCRIVLVKFHRLSDYRPKICASLALRPSVSTRSCFSYHSSSAWVSPHHYLFPNVTIFGSLGIPSLPIPCLSKLLSICILLASSKLTGPLHHFPLMIFKISVLEASSRPARWSPVRLALRSKLEDVRPDSMSPAKVLETAS